LIANFYHQPALFSHHFLLLFSMPFERFPWLYYNNFDKAVRTGQDFSEENAES